MPVGARQVDAAWLSWVAQGARYVIAPLLLFFSGFFTTAFVLSGVYTWPRTSRVLVLTLTIGILAYEFVYKEQRARYPNQGDDRPVRAVGYSCAVPYAAGCLVLLALARLGS